MIMNKKLALKHFTKGTDGRPTTRRRRVARYTTKASFMNFAYRSLHMIAGELSISLLRTLKR